ncbi:MAG TPA: hypothetical protein VGF48_00370 [Thermoanaerobaculia bacterium]|jgi:hypothetical protein
MTLLRVFVLSITLGVATGCASLATKYGPALGSVAGGYSETKLSATTYEVRFQANSFTNADTVGALLLRRAAELTLEAGQRYFVVTDRQPLSLGEAGDPALLATVRILDAPSPNAADAVEVIRQTDAMAGGLLSARAREHLGRLASTR